MKRRRTGLWNRPQITIVCIISSTMIPDITGSCSTVEKPTGRYKDIGELCYYCKYWKVLSLSPPPPPMSKQVPSLHSIRVLRIFFTKFRCKISEFLHIYTQLKIRKKGHGESFTNEYKKILSTCNPKKITPSSLHQKKTSQKKYVYLYKMQLDCKDSCRLAFCSA